jgi:hypothetical protein
VASLAFEDMESPTSTLKNSAYKPQNDVAALVARGADMGTHRAHAGGSGAYALTTRTAIEGAAG